MNSQTIKECSDIVKLSFVKEYSVITTQSKCFRDSKTVLYLRP